MMLSTSVSTGLKVRKPNRMKTTYQYRIYPTMKQRKTLEVWLDACRTLYNQALDMKKQAYDKREENITYKRQAAYLTTLRNASQFWQNKHCDVLQDTLRRLDKAYQAFFVRVEKGESPGFPRFKGEGRYRSMTFSHLSKRLIRNIRKRMARIVVPKIGHVAICYHRALPDGKIKNLTIQRKASGWYANIIVQLPDVPEIPEASIQTITGIDVGLASFVTTSNGDKVANPRHFRQSEHKLSQAQRRLSKRQKGSRRYSNQRERVAKRHEHIVNQRRDFHYKTAHRLFTQCDAIAVEALKITNMVQNHNLSKSISDAAWGNFRLTLQSKAAKAGKHLLKVKPQGTSQECSGCGSVVKKSLSVRVHYCPDCGLIIDRDHNAAINIGNRAAAALRGGTSVTNGSETLEREGSAKPVRPRGRYHKHRPSGRGS